VSLLFVESQKGVIDKFIKINKKNELENIGESSLNEEHKNINLGEDNNINIGEDNNRVVKDNNFDFQTHDINSNSQTRYNENIKMILILKIYTIQVNGKIYFGFLFSIKNLKLLGCVLLKEKCLNQVFEHMIIYWILMA